MGVYPIVSKPLLFKVWSMQQQQQYHLETCLKLRISNPTLDSLNQNLCFIRFPGWFLCTLFEKHCLQGCNCTFHLLTESVCKHIDPIVKIKVSCAPQKKSNCLTVPNWWSFLLVAFLGHWRLILRLKGHFSPKWRFATPDWESLGFIKQMCLPKPLSPFIYLF